MRLRWFVALASAVLLVIGVTVVVHDALESRSDAGDQVVGGGAADPGAEQPGEPGSEGDPEAGAIEVGGLVREVHLEGAVPTDPEIPTPLTIESERGFGNGGEVTGVTVNGRPSAIAWDGGRPFVLSEGPAFLLDVVTVDLFDGIVRCTLAGGAHRLAEGDYQLDTPVAVGGEGIATPRDQIAFRAGSGARFDGRGDAALALPPDRSHTFTGPGLVHLVGELEVLTDTGQQRASALDLRSGPYELTLSPTEGGGWTISGRVQSEVVGDLVVGR